MTAGHIDYEALVHEALRAAEQEALRKVVRSVLQQVARTGLTHDHHFYIAFNTQFPGVVLSKRLKEKYPAEMTIVLQHRFWDLEVGDDRFEVKLTFDGIPERLGIPLKAVKVFYDPSVPYGLQFEESELGAEARRGAGAERGEGGRPGRPRIVNGGPDGERAERRGDRARPPRVGNNAEAPTAPLPAQAPMPPIAAVPRPTAEPATSDTAVPENAAPEKASPNNAAPAAAPDRGPAAKPSARPVLAEVKPAEPAEPAPPDAGKVVDFSKFRKK